MASLELIPTIGMAVPLVLAATMECVLRAAGLDGPDEASYGYKKICRPGRGNTWSAYLVWNVLGDKRSAAFY